VKKFKTHTLKEYSNALSAKKPVPGGGSAAALTAGLGVALISMVAHYSLGKNKSPKVDLKIKKILRKSEKLRKRLLDLVDLDAKAYLKVVAARKGSLKKKQNALNEAREIPMEVCRLSYEAMELTPFLVAKGNKNLLSDIQVSVELLMAAFNAAMVNVKINK